MSKLNDLLSGLSGLLKFDNWAALVLNRLLFRKQGLVVYHLNGLEVLIDHQGGDQDGTRACLVTDMYSRYFDELSPEGAINVLDIGANGGGLPLSLKLAGFKFDKLACVEMNPATFSRLHFNVHRNINFAATNLLNAAACDRDGWLEVTLAHGSTSDSIHAQSTEGKPTRIQTITLDSLVSQSFGRESIDLCKIDIEGAEYELFEGPSSCLSQVRLLLIEIHPHPTKPKSQVFQKLQECGFAEVGTSAESNDPSACSVHLFKRL
jgi:FkbM family methyltransferase